MEHKISVTARVRVTLDIPLSGSWGGECSLEQVHKQAIEEVDGKLRGAIYGHGACKAPHIPGATIIDMTPIAISTERR